MFVDEVTIFVQAGDGGNGSVAFRREKYVPNGGPAGGDGGRGGNVIFQVDSGLNTLMDFRNQKHYRAPSGEAGGNNKCHGADGEDIIIKVPPGTLVRTEQDEVIADFIEPGESAVVARGGRGGKGNVHFVSSTHRAPRVAERGEPGEGRWLKIELNLLADVGLVGFPNAGKSTLIRKVSNARPKVGNYPFTTLVPNLGVVSQYGDPFVMADVPGLIEGAHTGQGLGDTFLRHLKRTRLLLHLVEMNPLASGRPFQDFEIIQHELAAFSPELAQREVIVVATKMDLEGAPALFEAFRERIEDRRVFAISSVTGEGVADLMWYVRQRLTEVPVAERVRQEPPVKPVVRGFKIEEDEESAVRVVGDVEERARMTMWGNPHAEAYFVEYLKRRGVDAALRRHKLSPGSAVNVGEGTVYWDGEAIITEETKKES